MTISPLIVGSVFAGLYVAILFWYGGRGKPLSPSEVDALLAEMQKRAGKRDQAEADSPLLQQFRELTKNDDGWEYYMVNLIKFRQKAIYPPGSSYDDDPLAANDRYNRAIIPLLLKYAGQGVDIHKWAALEQTQVFPLKPFFSLASVRLMVALLFIILALLVILLC